MLKHQVTIKNFVEPYQKKLEHFLESGGTNEEFTIQYPFEAGILYAAANISILLQ